MKKIYLDYAATTPVDTRVLKAMEPYWNKYFGNSMSLHFLGEKSDVAVDKSRQVVADFIGGQALSVIFTSSATESNNTALKGVMLANKDKGNHLMVSAIEHDCVLESAKWLAKRGFEVDFIPVDKYGMVDIDYIAKNIKKTTVLVSVIHGNNEVGSVQDIGKIGDICRKNGVLFHSDAAQSFGKVDIDVKRDKIDLLTISSHKIYGSKGVAVLYVGKDVKMEPLLHGGGQEDNKRSSTVNVAAIVGMAEAIKILQKEGKEENKRLKKMRDEFVSKVLASIAGSRLNGSIENYLPHIANISFEKIEGESLLLDLNSKGIMVSTGSACSSRSLQSSHVLTAMGIDHNWAHGSIRFSLGRWTDQKELDRTVVELAKTVNKFRKISPFK